MAVADVASAGDDIALLTRHQPDGEYGDDGDNRHQYLGAVVGESVFPEHRYFVHCHGDTCRAYGLSVGIMANLQPG
jgi:hypothetical protein